MGHVLGAERAREGGRAVGIALGMERHRDPVRTSPQFRQLEEDVARGLTLAGSTGQPACARGPRDLHVVREAFGGANEKRLRQLEGRLPADDALPTSST